MNTITPSYQIRVNDPYQQRLFDFNTQDSRLYLARVSNQLLRTFGNDIVLSGFTISSIVMDGPTARVTITGGTAIIDHTLIQISDSLIELDLDVSSYEDTGKIIIHLNYEYLQTVDENPLRIKLSYVNDTGSAVNPNGWNINKDRIILAVLSFTKDPSNNLTTLQEIPDVVKTITINSTLFYKFGYNVFNDQVLDQYFKYSNVINRNVTVNEQDLNKDYLTNKINVSNSLSKTIVEDSINSRLLTLSLANDINDPGANKFYGTTSTGERGWLDSPFSSDYDFSQNGFIDFNALVFSPTGSITYDSRGNINQIINTLRNSKTFTLNHLYNTRDDLIQVSAIYDNSTTVWTKFYSYNSQGDVTGWSVTIH